MFSLNRRGFAKEARNVSEGNNDNRSTIFVLFVSLLSVQKQNYIVPKSCGSAEFDGSSARWSLPTNAPRHEKVCYQQCNDCNVLPTVDDTR